MKQLLIKPLKTFFLFGVLFAVVNLPTQGEAASNTSGKNIMIQLQDGTNDLHSAFMALKIGRMMASRGHNTTLFVNLEGVRIADKRQPNDLTYGGAKTLKDHYNAFIEAGGNILVCPHCAKVAGISKSELRKGAQIASEKDIAKLIEEADKILDY